MLAPASQALPATGMTPRRNAPVTTITQGVIRFTPREHFGLQETAGRAPIPTGSTTRGSMVSLQS
jgi:hypothetical protein